MPYIHIFVKRKIVRRNIFCFFLWLRGLEGEGYAEYADGHIFVFWPGNCRLGGICHINKIPGEPAAT